MTPYRIRYVKGNLLNPVQEESIFTGFGNPSLELVAMKDSANYDDV